MKHLPILLALFLSIQLAACKTDGDSDTSSTTPINEPPEQSESVTATTDNSYVLASPVEQPFEVRVIGHSGTGSNATKINDNGVVAGNYFVGPGHANAFRWENDKLTTLINDGQATDLNEIGDVSGWRETRDGQVGVVIAYNDVEVTRAPINTVLYGINDQTEAVGKYIETVGVYPENGSYSPIWAYGAESYLLDDSFNGYAWAVSEEGEVIVHELIGDDVVPGILTENGIDYFQTLGGKYTYTRDINKNGQVVGWGEISRDLPYNHAIVWENGLALDYTPPNENYCSANGINDLGDIVVRCSGPEGSKGYVIYDGGAIVRLQFEGADNIMPNDINNNRQIVGWMSVYPESGRETRGFIATPKNM